MKLETQTEQLISETVTVYGLSPQIGVHALAQTANALAAQGTVFSVCPDITEDEETDTDIKNEDMQDTHASVYRLPIRNMCSNPESTRSKNF